MNKPGVVEMRRTLVFALAMAGLVANAHAADVDLFPFKAPQFKDPLPDSLTWYGITVYGTLDLGYAYQTNGTPLGSVVSGLEFIPFTTTRNYTGQAISTFAHSGLRANEDRCEDRRTARARLGRRSAGGHGYRSDPGKTLGRLQLRSSRTPASCTPTNLERGQRSLRSAV